MILFISPNDKNIRFPFPFSLKGCLFYFVQDLRSSNLYGVDDNSPGGKNGRGGSHQEVIIDEEAPFIPSAKGLLSRPKPS